MPLHVYPSIGASGKVPAGWVPSRHGTIKYSIRPPSMLRYLRTLLPGRWKKVIKKGTTGEVHYFEHESGRVADVKFY
jgi:hypothetical protein